MTRLDEILAKARPDPDDLAALLGADARAEQCRLQAAAYAVKVRTVGAVVYFRGLFELSNLCSKDCLYCGIRRSNRKVDRYLIPIDEILAGARWAYEQGYGSVVLQSGERSDPVFVDLITELVTKIRALSQGQLAITLSVGEQSEATYRTWFQAGAERYLLRIETSDPALYRRLHPADHSWERRRDCLRLLHGIGYQLGSGAMIGLPGQSVEQLAQDVLFFEQEKVVMIGMGPFIPHADTPMRESIRNFAWKRHAQLALALRMIAVTRLYLPDVNIAAATALQTLAPDGREQGLMAGANVIMPNLTDPKYRSAYQLYDGKPCLDESATQCRGCLQARIASLGETIGFGQRGDSRRFVERKKAAATNGATSAGQPPADENTGEGPAMRRVSGYNTKLF
jgi:biotin synthase